MSFEGSDMQLPSGLPTSSISATQAVPAEKTCWKLLKVYLSNHDEEAVSQIAQLLHPVGIIVANQRRKRIVALIRADR
jgi:hypothetical protein